MKNISYEDIDIQIDPRLEPTYPFLELAHRMLESVGFFRAVAAKDHPEDKRLQIDNVTIIKAFIGMLLLQDPVFAHLTAYRIQEQFKTALGADRIPAESTLRYRFKRLGTYYDDEFKAANIALIKRFGPPLKRLHLGSGTAYVPVFVDDSIHEQQGTEKEGVTATYKKVKGYGVHKAFLPLDGYWVNGRLSEGREHSAAHADEFIRETLRYLQGLGGQDMRFVVVMDRGYDSAAIRQGVVASGADFIIKRNFRKEKELYYQLIRHWAYGDPYKVEQLRYKRSERKETWLRWDENDSRCWAVVIEEKKPRQLVWGLKGIECYWTNLTDLEGWQVSELYRSQGLGEQGHREVKTDLDLNTLPSGNMDVNRLVLNCAGLASTILNILGRLAVEYKRLFAGLAGESSAVDGGLLDALCHALGGLIETSPSVGSPPSGPAEEDPITSPPADHRSTPDDDQEAASDISVLDENEPPDDPAQDDSQSFSYFARLHTVLDRTHHFFFPRRIRKTAVRLRWSTVIDTIMSLNYRFRFFASSGRWSFRFPYLSPWFVIVAAVLISVRLRL